MCISAASHSSPLRSFHKPGLLLEASCLRQESSDSKYMASPSSVFGFVVAGPHECGVSGGSCARPGKACFSHPSDHVADWLPDYQDPLLLRASWLAGAKLEVALHGYSAVVAAALAAPHRGRCPGLASSGAHWRRGKWRLPRVQFPLRWTCMERCTFV